MFYQDIKPLYQHNFLHFFHMIIGYPGTLGNYSNPKNFRMLTEELIILLGKHHVPHHFTLTDADLHEWCWLSDEEGNHITQEGLEALPEGSMLKAYSQRGLYQYLDRKYMDVDYQDYLTIPREDIELVYVYSVLKYKNLGFRIYF